MVTQKKTGLKTLLLAALIFSASCERKEELPSQFASEDSACAAPGEPVFIEGGAYIMGADDAYPEEGPAHQVAVSSFWIDPAEVTVARFAAFIEATGYVTVAEKPVNPETFEGAPAVNATVLEPGGAVFQPSPNMSLSAFNWWKYVPGANWRYPRGPNNPAASALEPVTQIAFEDALAFAQWARGRLPTEAEWEYAANAGGANAVMRSAPPEEANTWQGIFPVQNTKRDGYEGVAPAGCFEPNAFGLYDMIGNVWEWTANWYAPGHEDGEGGSLSGPPADRSYDPRNPGVAVRVVKGGSYLCAENYCMRYRPSARHAQDTGLGTNHIGFRLVYDNAEPK